MPKKRKSGLPFKARTMGSAQHGLDLARGRKEAKAAAEHTSTVTVLRPDESGNLVEVETVAPVFSKAPAKSKRPKVPKGSRSLL